MRSKGKWQGWYVSTLYSIVSIVLFGVTVVTLIFTCKSHPEFLKESENSLRKWEAPPIRQWELSQMAFIAALILDFASWLWTVDTDKSRLFYLVVVINGLPIISYGLLANGLAPIWIDCRGRRIILIRYVQWLFTTPAMLYLYSIVSALPEAELVIALGMEVICIVSGFLASYVRFPFDIISLAISCGSFYLVIAALNKMLMLAIEETSVDDNDYRRALNGARIFMVVTWIGMPFIWFLAYFDMISMTAEETLYEILDFSTKAGVSAMILHSSIKLYSEKLEEHAQLALSEERNKTILALQEAAQVKDKFFTAMSHELRTPLNGIIGLADGLMVGSCGEVPDKVRDRLGTIKLSGQRLCSLVNDILDAASLRHDALRLVEDNVILVDVCAHVVELTRAVAKRGVAVSCHVDADVPVIRGDPERIKQVP